MSNVASERLVNGIKTRVLHGKDYVEVAERVRIAHSGDAEFEQVATEHFSIETRWFVRCVILVKGRHFIGTAEIKFTAPKNTPDGTNPFECAETSALGRALAFAGLGTVESIASFDEVYRVQSIEEAEMGGRPVIEAAKPKQIAAPVVDAPAQPPIYDRSEALRELTRPGPARAGKGQPEPESIDNADETVRRMIIIARSRCQKAGLDWEAVKTGVFGVPTPDKDLISKSFMHINKHITESEQSRKTA